MAALLSAVLFVSGAAGVAFQTLWFRQAGLVLGNSVWASSIVLASFMAGLGLGNALSATIGDRLRRPLAAFALCECTIGAVGFAIVAASFSLPGVIAPWLRPLAEMPVALDVARIAIAFSLLLVPATAMGFTLPLLVRVLFERRSNFGVALGRLYGWNTIGAVCGAVAWDAFLIGRVGVVGAAAAAAACNVLAAFGGMATARLVARPDAIPPAAEPPAARAPPAVLRSTPELYPLLAAAFVSGGIFLALEVVWFRFLTLFVYSNALAFSRMLAVVLLGIGAGGVAAARWLARDPRASRFAPALACVCGVLCIATYAQFKVAFAPYGTGYPAHARDVFYLAACLMLPSALATGVLFSLLGAAARHASDSPARAAGRFVLANTFGSAVGPLIAGFVLLPLLGMERSFFGLAAAYGAVALLSWGAGLRAMALPGAVALVLTLTLFPFGLMQRTYLTIPVQRVSLDEHDKVVATREGVTETILYLRADRFGRPYSYRLVSNATSMSSTLPFNRRYMQLFVYLPVALHPDIHHSLLISYGVGSTARALLDTPGMESVDVVDVSRDILEMSAIPHLSAPEDPLRDPRVRVHVEDGRFFLQVTDRHFD
ncbi:MAG TPA: spermidine synthase, partial [Myxococcota bacterium]|nr:spermidine synthase [Myxococcota bacterium]